MFPVRHGAFGVDVLAGRLNALVEARQIGGWHPGRWSDWHHTMLAIDFETAADAALAQARCHSAATESS
jgi:hypothetical protein